MEHLSITSFLANGHQFHLYAYDSIAGLPAGVTIMDANQILPQFRVLYLLIGPCRVE